MLLLTLRLDGLVQQMARHDDDDISEQKAVEKPLRVIPAKYTQISLSMETLWDLLTLTIEDPTGRLKVVDNRIDATGPDPVTIGGKLLYTEE